MRRTVGWIGVVTLALTMLVAGPAEAATPAVTLKAVPTSTTADGDPAFGLAAASGTATGVRAGASVFIDSRASGRWRTAAVAKVDGRGRYETRLPSPRAGTNQLRARIVVGGTSRVSATVTVRLSKLFALTARASASSRGAVDSTTHGTSAVRTVQLRAGSGTAAFVTWRLDGRCQKFVGAAAVVPGTKPGTDTVRVSVTTWVKGVAQLQVLDLSRTAATDISRGVRNVTTLRIAIASATSGGADTPVLAVPSVLCTATPTLGG